VAQLSVSVEKNVHAKTVAVEQRRINVIEATQIEVLNSLKQACLNWISSFGLSRDEAEDVYQQSMIKAINFQEEDKIRNLKTWFYQILKNTALDELRRKKSHHSKQEALFHELSDLAASHEMELNFCQCVSGLMMDLNSLEQDILRKHFFENIALKDLAVEFNLSEANLRQKALRARGKLKELFKLCCGATEYRDLTDCHCAPK
jgi:RNA polymerase sigma-70 factor (ECF subfamily)